MWEYANLEKLSTLADVTEGLQGVDRVLVTGPQRSGTTIASKMLSHKLGLKLVDESLIGPGNRNDFLKFIAENSGFVIQFPNACDWLQLIEDKGTLGIVFMIRDDKSILASQNRINWRGGNPLGYPQFSFDLLPPDIKKVIDFKQPLCKNRKKVWLL